MGLIEYARCLTIGAQAQQAVAELNALKPDLKTLTARGLASMELARAYLTLGKISLAESAIKDALSCKIALTPMALSSIHSLEQQIRTAAKGGGKPPS
jgi:hypothetical protein